MFTPVVIADDLTGACEVAGLGHRHGLASRVALAPGADVPASGELVVYTTETRLLTDNEAAERIRMFAAALPQGAFVFKKTDSVLRGPIAAELAAAAASLNRPRVVLAAANPALHRLVINGRYVIDGAPLHQTAFARDPHHPARTDQVSRLLGRWSGEGRKLCAAPGKALPKRGLVLADVASAGDLTRWAATIDDQTLPAGSAAFFDALLERFAPSGRRTLTAFEVPSGPTLMLSGTVTPAQRALAAGASPETISLHDLEADALEAWINRVRARLARTGTCVAYVEGPVVPDATLSARITEALASLAGAVGESAGPTPLHLVIEGGATAAAVAGVLGWSTFRVVQEWSPGVVMLQPDQASALRLTLKPGSYPWPAALRERLFGAHALSPS